MKLINLEYEEIWSIVKHFEESKNNLFYLNFESEIVISTAECLVGNNRITSMPGKYFMFYLNMFNMV